MKTKKILLPVVLILSLLLSGCNHEAIIDNALLELAQQLTEPEDVVEPFIGFAREDVEDVEDLHQLEPEMLQNYISEYSRYNTYSYFQHLNDTEKLVYRAYEYAMDHGYPYTWFDIRLTDGIEWSVFDILQFLALDSALVDQNISQSIQVKTVTHSVLNIQTAKETYTTVYMDHFTLKRLERKQQAMSEARVILEDVSPSWTDRQKAEYFYDYLVTTSFIMNMKMKSGAMNTCTVPCVVALPTVTVIPMLLPCCVTWRTFAVLRSTATLH